MGFIGTNRFLQITPQHTRFIDPRKFYGEHFFQVWSFWKLELEGDRMILGELKNKLDIKHGQQDVHWLVLTTSSTKELKEFIGKHVNDQSVYQGNITFSRQK
jgi:hypothetical protein